MKNKSNKIKNFIIFLLFYFNLINLFAEDIVINAEVVDIKEKGNLILATGSVDIVDGKSIKITGNNAKYNKTNQTLEIEGDVVFYDRIKNYRATSDKVIFNRSTSTLSSSGNTLFRLFDNLNDNIIFEINSENSFFDQNKQILKLTGDVILNDLLNDYRLYSKKIIYNYSKNLIESYDATKINYKDEILINTQDISFDNNQKIFYTKNKTSITDNFENNFELSSLEFNLINKIFKGENITLRDKDRNILEMTNGFVDLKSNELTGSDFNINFNKNLFGNSENDPRLIGRYIISNKSNTKMKKSSFTTCKNIEGRCPAWSISADEVIHKKKQKRIEYKKAWVEIYDVPVAYFPYFFHPDPTVKRQSGFLFPQFNNNSNLGFSTQIPYYKVIDSDQDMTISPRVFTNNNLFVQTEYRQVYEKSNLITDFSINKKGSFNSHFFSTLSSDFDDSFYQVKIETATGKDYLKKYQIQSPLVKSNSVLNSSVSFNKYTDDFSFSSSIEIIEDLSKSDSDKYEYILPTYEFNTDTYLNESLFDSLSISSSGNFRKYDTNKDEFDVINDFKLNSNQDLLTNLNTDLNILFRNLNTYGNLSSSYKEKEDYKLFGATMLNVKYPLIKNYNNGINYLTPIASLRYSPNKGPNLQNDDKHIKYDDLFKLDRINNKTIESDIAATIGLEFKNIDNFNSENLKFGFAMNFRDKYDDNLPLSSSLGKRTSDIIGYSGINITENLSFKYNFSLEKNLSETNYSLVSADYSGNKFKTSFEYMEKSKYIGDESYLTNYTQFDFDGKNSLAFETTKNIDKNITDYYNLIYKYKNDCLEASAVFNKQFYDDSDVNSGKNIFFKISFIPFGTVNTPNLND